MTKFLSAAVVVVCFAAACGGTTETEDPGAAGSAGKNSAGQGGSSGTGAAGKPSGGKTGSSGSSATAGVSMGGAETAGAAGEGATAGQGQGGVAVAGAAGAAGAGGMPSVDKRCPAKRPTGACGYSALSCIYSSGTNCLCYPNPPNTFRPCQQVDPQCTYSPTPPPEDAGSGGYSAKVALPPTQSCTCNAETWTCNFF